MVRNFPLKLQASLLARIAAEFEQFGDADAANKLWSELELQVEQTHDQTDRIALLKSLAQERTRAGNLDKAKVIVNQIAEPSVRHEAIQLVTGVLCDTARFQEAVAFAESIPRSTPILFDAMEEIALAAAGAGNTKVAFRASRGMNPGQGGSMARKLRAATRMCSSFYKQGQKKEAICFMKEAKMLSDVMKLDLETTLVVDTTWAALQADDFETKLKELLLRLDDQASAQLEKEIVRIGIAGRVLDFGHHDLLKHFKGGSKEYRLALDAIKSHHVVNFGDAAAVETLKTHKNPLLLVKGFSRLAPQCTKSNESEAIVKYLDRAERIVKTYLEKESRPSYFIDIFSEFIAAKSSTGQYKEALGLARQYPDSDRIPELFVRVVASMR